MAELKIFDMQMIVIGFFMSLLFVFCERSSDNVAIKIGDGFHDYFDVIPGPTDTVVFYQIRDGEKLKFEIQKIRYEVNRLKDTLHFKLSSLSNEKAFPISLGGGKCVLTPFVLSKINYTFDVESYHTILSKYDYRQSVKFGQWKIVEDGYVIYDKYIFMDAIDGDKNKLIFGESPERISNGN